MSIRRAARSRFGHEHSNTIVVGGWAAKALLLAAAVAGIKWLTDHARIPGDVDWLTVGGVIVGGVLVLYVVTRLFRPRIRG